MKQTDQSGNFFGCVTIHRKNCLRTPWQYLKIVHVWKKKWRSLHKSAYCVLGNTSNFIASDYEISPGGLFTNAKCINIMISRTHANLNDENWIRMKNATQWFLNNGKKLFDYMYVLVVK